MKNSFERIDNFLDRMVGEAGYTFLARAGRYVISLVSISLLAMCTAHFVANGSTWSPGMVGANLHKINEALLRFDQDCGIQRSVPGRYSLHFLTLRYPSVDDLGGFLLKSTQGFAGPYMRTVPVVDGYPYALVVNAQGMFIVPGDGVQLPNGHRLGKEIFLDAESDIEGLVANGILAYQGEPLVRKYTPGSFSPLDTEKDRSMLREFLSAFTVASRESTSLDEA